MANDSSFIKFLSDFLDAYWNKKLYYLLGYDSNKIKSFGIVSEIKNEFKNKFDKCIGEDNAFYVIDNTLTIDNLKSIINIISLLSNSKRTYIYIDVFK